MSSSGAHRFSQDEYICLLVLVKRLRSMSVVVQFVLSVRLPRKSTFALWSEPARAQHLRICIRMAVWTVLMACRGSFEQVPIPLHVPVPVPGRTIYVLVPEHERGRATATAPMLMHLSYAQYV